MASGTPDYFQSVRQDYGAAKKAADDVVAVANTKKSIISVSGKGVIYGGILIIDYTSDQSLSMPILSVDGIEIALTSFLTLNFYNMTMESSYPLYIIYYDQIINRYAVAITKGFTFESGFEILYHEQHGTTPTVSCLCTYALLT